MALYLGIDAGTQSIKGIVIDPEKKRCYEPVAVHYGKDLPQFCSPDGFLPNADDGVRHANPLMWAAALDFLLERLAASGIPMEDIAGISGSGQQHGSVYLNADFAKCLANLDASPSLAEAITPALSRNTAPIWMDHSTTAECAAYRAKFGARMQELTGSAPTERFTGPQIRKFYRTEPEAYRRTATIHLVSSFLCSLLIGKSAPVDYGDGAGMNLLNLNTLAWEPEFADFTAPDLLKKLPQAVPSSQIAGTLPGYFAKYRLRTGIPVAVWSGDNPNSLIGIGCAQPGTACISLGSSDTLFAATRKYVLDAEGCGHIMGNPAGGFMSLICFSNGSLARERVRKECGADWDFFDRKACELTTPGNGGKLILPWFEPESTPPQSRPGAYANYDEKSALPEEKIRAIMESQALAMRLHTRWLPEPITHIRLTGGASRSAAMRRILANVFQTEVETIAVTESAALGAAIRAANATGGFGFAELSEAFCGAVALTQPDQNTAGLYANLLKEYETLERSHRENR